MVYVNRKVSIINKNIMNYKKEIKDKGFFLKSVAEKLGYGYSHFVACLNGSVKMSARMEKAIRNFLSTH